jgi:hypothetical protein
MHSLSFHERSDSLCVCLPLFVVTLSDDEWNWLTDDPSPGSVIVPQGVGVGVAPVIGIPKVGVSGGIGVSGVEVGVSGGIGVSVGVTGVLVGSCVSVGVTGVFVGGIGVRVGRTAVFVGMGVGRGRRVLVGSLEVGNLKAVGVRGATEAVGLDVSVGRKVGVGVGINSANACNVSAPAVFKLETAESTMFAGSKAPAVIASFRSWIAIPETEHNRLIPSAPATKTARRPR